MRNLFLRHCQVSLYSLGKACRNPLPTLMTTAVIGIALALPLGLQVLLQNAQRLTSGWDSAAQISLFLKKDSSAKSINNLASNLQKRKDIKSVKIISREQALNEFRQYSGFTDALDALAENPLPPVIVVYPILGEKQSPLALQTLVSQLRTLEGVDIAQLDMQWIQRLYALMDIVRQGVWVLGTLLALSVLLIVGNTIRLAIENQRDEIEITKLIGATNAFIRRPFLYTGIWYGLDCQPAGQQCAVDTRRAGAATRAPVSEPLFTDVNRHNYPSFCLPVCYTSWSTWIMDCCRSSS